MAAVFANNVRPVRVLIVDDSALVRQLLAELLSADPQIAVVGTASDPLIAREKIKQLSPDVLTLDIEMPRMDGLTFLQQLMRLRPMPVVMVSSLTQKGAAVTLDALSMGAVDFVPKPVIDVARGLSEYAEELALKIKQAARMRVGRIDQAVPRALSSSPSYRGNDHLLAIGASTGGTEAIRHVLEAMPADAPATVIAQHIPGTFSAAFAERLNRHSRMTVCEAQDGQALLAGHAYVAPGGRHLRVQRNGARWSCRVSDDAPVSGHRRAWMPCSSRWPNTLAPTPAPPC